MLGAGVAIFNNPLPIGFGDIPIWDPQSPEVQALMAQVNQAIADTGHEGGARSRRTSLTRRSVALLATIYAQLGELPPLPETPEV